MKKKGRKIALWTSLVLALSLLYFFRPWFHGLVMLFWIYPLTPNCLLALVASVGWVILRTLANDSLPWSKRDERKSLAWPVVGVFLSTLFLIVYAVIARDLQLWIAHDVIKYYRREVLPETRVPRILPFAVAKRYGVDALQEPTQRPYEWQPVLVDGRFSWVTARVPDGIMRYFFRKTAGLEIVHADSTARDVRFVNQTLGVSEGVAVTDSIYWKLFKRRYFVNLPEVFYSVENGQAIAIAPIVTYRGLLIRYPAFDGYFAVYPDGRVEEHGAPADPNDPLIKSAGRVFPEYLARFQARAYAFRLGFWNVWLWHEDQPEINDPEGELNGQPYLLDTVEGLRWVTAADPYGTSFAVFKIFLTNALTGNVEVLEIPKQSALTGAQQAVGYVRSTFPQFNWETTSGNTTTGNIVAVEPRPEISSNKLYWMISVTTSDHKGVNLTTLVDAKTNKVVGFDSDEKVVAFVREREAVAAPVETIPTPAPKPESDERIKKLEDLLHQALRQVEELKK